MPAVPESSLRGSLRSWEMYPELMARSISSERAMFRFARTVAFFSRPGFSWSDVRESPRAAMYRFSNSGTFVTPSSSSHSPWRK